MSLWYPGGDFNPGPTLNAKQHRRNLTMKRYYLSPGSSLTSGRHFSQGP
jgi:hypothetical protein